MIGPEPAGPDVASGPRSRSGLRDRARSLEGSDVVLIAATALIHAGGWIAAEVAVESIAPIALASLRFLVAGGFLLVVARLRGASLGTDDWRALLVVSLIGVALSHALFYYGLRLAPVADGVVLSTALSPTLAVVLALPVLHERLSRGGAVGVALSAVGVTLVVFEAGRDAAGGDRLIGDGLVILASIATALYTVIGRVAMRSGSPLGVVASTTFIGGVALAPLALVEATAIGGGSWPLEAWIAFLYLTVPSAGLSAVLYYMLIRRSGAARGSTVAYVVPIFVLGFSALALDQPITVSRLAGAILAIVGVRLVLRGSSQYGRLGDAPRGDTPGGDVEGGDEEGGPFRPAVGRPRR